MGLGAWSWGDRTGYWAVDVKGDKGNNQAVSWCSELAQGIYAQEIYEARVVTASLGVAFCCGICKKHAM